MECFGGPADGQLHEATLASGATVITARLWYFDLHTMKCRGTVILVTCTYEPDILPIGQDKQYRTKTVLRWKQPRKLEEDDGA
jgi:hypothetical protein